MRLRPFICTKIERPSLLEKPPCKVRFFANRYSRKYRQKVTVTTLFQTTSHRTFSTSHTNAPRSLSRVKAGTHSAFGERSHTRAHTAKQGHSLPRPQCGFALPVNSFLFRHTFIYIHFPVHCEPPLSAERKSGETAAINFIPNRFSSQFSTSPTNGPRLPPLQTAGTHSAFGERSHTSAYTPKQGMFQMGCYYYPRTVSHVSENLRGQGVERQTVPLLGLGRGHSRRTQRACGTAMRLCASLPRGVAAPLGCVIFLQFGDVAVFSLCAQHFLNVQGCGGITTLGVLCVLLKHWTAACQKGSFAAF